MDKDSAFEELFAKVATKTSQAAGSFWTFSAAVLVVLVWAGTGPFFGYSETWQLVINTGTTIVTFLMVFVIQHAQNKDMRAVQLKLNELIAAVEGASNRLIDVEDLSDRELEHMYARFQHLAESAQKLSHGAKLTIDGDADGDAGGVESATDDVESATDDVESATDDVESATAHGHPHAESGKKAISSTEESRRHSQKPRR